MIRALAYAFLFLFATGIILIGVLFAGAARDSALAQERQAQATDRLAAAMEESARASQLLRTDWVRAVRENSDSNMPTRLETRTEWGQPTKTSTFVVQALPSPDGADVRNLVARTKLGLMALSEDH